MNLKILGLWEAAKKQLDRAGTVRDLYAGRLGVTKADLVATIYRADGTVENLGVICRKKVTNAFVADLVDAMAGGSAYAGFDNFNFHDCGTGSTAEANTQTALVTPFGGARVTGTQVAGGSGGARTYTSVATISFTSTLAIVEHAIFNASSTGTMLDRSVFSAINVNNGDSIQFTYVLTVNSEA